MEAGTIACRHAAMKPWCHTAMLLACQLDGHVSACQHVRPCGQACRQVLPGHPRSSEPHQLHSLCDTSALHARLPGPAGILDTVVCWHICWREASTELLTL